MHQTDTIVIESVLIKLEDHSDEVRKVVSDLIDSGFEEVDELVELAAIARESIIQPPE